MKKLLVFLITLVGINVLSAQTTFLRATGMIAAVKSQYTDKFLWGEPKPVDILIRVDDSKVTIYSKVTQVYRTISLVKNTSNTMTYYCNDANGIGCNISVYMTESAPGSVFVYIEYNDVAWMYETHRD